MIALAALAAAASIYGNVFMHPQTGDMLGMEVRLHTGQPPSIDFALCEGACYGAKDIPITIRPGGFDFLYREKLVDQAGKPVPDKVRSFSARFRRRRLVVQEIGGGGAHETLKPIRGPVGLTLLSDATPTVP